MAASTARATSIYEALNAENQEFRLLTLQAGAFDDPIQCTLHKASLRWEPKPSYETTSYCWGDKTDRAHIQLNGELRHVPKSAEQILRRIRLQDQDRIVWLDAVCISQSDDAERSQQVSMMNLVYQYSARSLVHLGEDDGFVEDAVKALDLVTNKMGRATNGCEILYEALHHDDGNLKTASREPDLTSDLDVSAIRRLFERRWFTRLWVIQEATLPPESICYFGEYVLPLLNILRAAAWLHYKRLSLPDGFAYPGIRAAVAIFDYADRQHGAFTKRGFNRDPFSSILNTTHSFMTTESRDRIYALLGLYQYFSSMGSIPPLLVPDYSKSLARVYEDATRYWIKRSGNLHALHHVEFGRQDSSQQRSEHADFASWVPLWDRIGHGDGPWKLTKSFRPVRRTPVTTHKVFGTGSPGILITEGFHFGHSAEHVSAARDVDFKSYESLWEKMQSIQNCARSHSDTFYKRLRPTSSLDIVGDAPADPLFDEMAATIIAGQLSRNPLTATATNTRLCARYFKNIKRRRKMNTQPMEDLLRLDLGGADRKIAVYHRVVKQVLRDRCFFVTSNGYLGVGPSMMQAGDVVVVLYGDRFPFVLRPWDKDEDEYTLLGPCYVHGIMEGEAMQAHVDSGAEDRKFILR